MLYVTTHRTLIITSSSSAYHSPQLDIGLSNIPPSRSIFGLIITIGIKVAVTTNDIKVA
jgi:hypothetical protein